MNGKLKVLVRVDLEGAEACIKVRGPVDTRNVQALYCLARRANALTAGLDVIIDLTAADAGPEVLDDLQRCAHARRLPPAADPAGNDCRLRILTPAAPAPDGRTAADLILAA